METRTDNEIIAEFMGVKIGVDMYSWRPGVSNPIRVEDLAYDKQWGWLMPVVQKITPLAKELGQQAWGDTAYHLLRADIRVVYNQVLSFIKWYTSNQPQKAS